MLVRLIRKRNIDNKCDVNDQYLHQTLHTNLNAVDHDLFNEWSGHLSRFLGKSSKKIYRDLIRLFDVYQTKRDVRYCLKVLESFTIFPSYPDLEKGDFVEHIHYVCNYLSLVENNNIPKVPIISFPKSGSSFVNVVLHQLFDMRPAVLSFHHTWGIKSWINAFCKWGGITHDHYKPTRDNLKLLNDANIKKCIIHSRHPVEILISLANHYIDNDLPLDKNSLAEKNTRLKLLRDYFDREIDSYFERFAVWHQAWRNEAKSGNLEVLGTHYDDMKRDQLAFFKCILSFCDVSYDDQKLIKILDDLDPKKAKDQYNFRKASTNEWGEVFTDEHIRKIKSLSAKFEFEWNP